MGKRPDDVYQDIVLTREQITQRVREMRERGKDDAQELRSRVEDVFQGAGLRDQVEQRPLTVLAGALGVGVVLGMASESVNVRSLLGADPGHAQTRSLYDRGTHRRSDGGLFAGLSSALETAAVEEGRQLLHEWIGGLRASRNERPGAERAPVYDERRDDYTRAGSPESPFTR